MTFLNNINFSLLIGIPLIVYAPFILRQKQLSQSIKDRSFRKIILIAVITPLILIILTGLVYSTAGFTMVELWRRIFVYSAVTLIIVMTGFLIVSYYVRKDIADPLKKLAGDVDEDVTNKNELDILSSKLNFVANNQTKLKGNEFDLYIGLTSKDGKSFSYDEAKGIVDNICLNYVEGFVSSQSEGGYKGEETKYEEKVLIYKIFGATDEQIKNIVDDVLSSLNQESILVEKNKINRWYISK